MKRNWAINLAEILVLLALPMLSAIINILYIILVIIIIVVSRYLRKEKWTDYGFKPVKVKMLMLAAGIGIVFAFTDNYLLEPLVNSLTGTTPDLSTFENIKGNIVQLFVLLAIGWVVGGFFEEFFFRGYLLNRINSWITNPVIGKWAGMLATSIAFAVAHAYQGIGGIITTFYFSVIMVLLYYYFKKNVWYVILVHGFYDTVGILYLYFE
jgi:membrane protease YdiL (CAAX protease family)